MYRSVALLAVLGFATVSAFAANPPFDVRFRADGNQSEPSPNAQTTTRAQPTTVAQTTTTAQPTTVAQGGGGGGQTCKNFDRCWSSDGCGNGGSCTGFAVGKCVCSCANLVVCQSDVQCGGLKGSCVNGRCDCDKGFEQNGLGNRIEATQKFCNQQTCTQNGNECFGLPCGSGSCWCGFGGR